MSGSGRASGSPSAPEIVAPEQWVNARGFVLRFVLLFALLEAFVYLVLWHERWFAPYAEWNVRAAAALLAPFMADVRASGTCLMTSSFSILVRPGCDAYQASAVMVAGMAAFPATLARKLTGALLGTACLVLLNLGRLGALLWTGMHEPELFTRMHLEILPAVFVGAALSLLLGWALWARRR